VKFEWDGRKEVENEQKHGVSFHEAATVFGDPLAITFDDPDHSINEQRLITFGVSRLNRYIIVSHTERNDIMRIISARKMTKHEKIIYEKG